MPHEPAATLLLFGATGDLAQRRLRPPLGASALLGAMEAAA